ncbi:tetratricopeptide repeat protein [Alteromonas gracilis]|uniref:tetratricopeptide repeat protein n=1 Tax=Alteromonas gracilis TaxID=1479524 RepID=UPI0037361F73
MSNLLIETLLAGIAKNPDDKSLLRHLAEAYKSNGDEQKALETLQQLVAKDIENTAVLKELVTLMDSLSHPDATVYGALLQSRVENIEPADLSQEQLEQADAPKRVRGAKLKLVSTSDDSEDIEDSEITTEKSDIYLDDVAGMNDVKKRIRLSFLAPLQNPKLSKQLGKKVSGGMILYGPPGCGKTFIARALAGELGAKFISVGMADILDMYVGESERKLHSIFQTARENAPTVLFFDELDALGHKRTNLKNSAMRTLVNQLLNEMDSIDSNNENIFVLGATNLPWDVDQALKRPGRFDRMIAVFPPDLEARKAIFKMNLVDSPKGALNINQLAEQTELYSGADIAHLCQSAIEQVFEESLESGNVRGVENEDFQIPLKEVKPSTKGWFESARNYALFSNDNGNFNELLAYIKQHKL